MKHGKSKASSAPGRQLAMKRSRDTIWWKAPNYKISVLPVRATAQSYRVAHRGVGENRAETRLEIHLQRQTSHAFEYSRLLDLAPAQKDVVQQGQGIPKVQDLFNSAFWRGTHRTEIFSGEFQHQRTTDTQSHQHEWYSPDIKIPSHQPKPQGWKKKSVTQEVWISFDVR